jgi:hypothetical protein
MPNVSPPSTAIKGEKSRNPVLGKDTEVHMYTVVHIISKDP